MCGRARCTQRTDDFPRACHRNDGPVRYVDMDRYRPSYNVSPGFNVPVLRREDASDGEGSVLHCMKWGLVPSFTKKTEKPDHYKMLFMTLGRVLKVTILKKDEEWDLHLISGKVRCFTHLLFLQPLPLQPCSGCMAWYPVTPAMGKPSFDGPECIKEIQLKTEENATISKFFSRKGVEREASKPEGKVLSHEPVKTELPKSQNEEPETEEGNADKKIKKLKYS